MENTTISFNKIGIVSEILERMNPAIEFLPRDKKTIVISFKREGFQDSRELGSRSKELWLFASRWL